jgi:hypothetical protein
VFEELTRLSRFANVTPGKAEAPEGAGKLAAVRTVLTLPDGESAFEELTRLVRFAQVTPSVAEAGQRGGDLGMV